MKSIIFLIALIPVLSTCSNLSDKDEGIVFTDADTNVWIGNKQINFTFPENIGVPGEEYRKKPVFDAASSQLFLVLETTRDPGNIYIYNLTTGILNTDQFIIIPISEDIGFSFDIYDSKLLIPMGSGKYEIYNLITHERVLANFSYSDHIWSLLGFNGEQLIFGIIDKSNKDIILFDAYAEADADIHTNTYIGICYYTIRTEEIREYPIQKNLTRIAYVPQRNEFIGIDGKNHDIFIFDVIKNEYRNTSARRKKLVYSGTGKRPDYFYIEQDYLYFSQYEYNPIREAFVLLFPPGAYVQYRKWYRFDLRTKKTERIYQPNPIVQILGRATI
jgi:hypothetical protein